MQPNKPQNPHNPAPQRQHAPARKDHGQGSNPHRDQQQRAH